MFIRIEFRVTELLYCYYEQKKIVMLISRNGFLRFVRSRCGVFCYSSSLNNNSNNNNNKYSSA